jgi:hypothetical protein
MSGRQYTWFDLTNVCRKWRAVMFASSCRLGLGIAVGPQKPSDIETILSGSLPIFIDYRNMGGDINGSALSALWRMRAALKHHDRVREISFEVSSADFDEFFRATSFPFPVLKRLDIFFSRRRSKNSRRIPQGTGSITSTSTTSQIVRQFPCIRIRIFIVRNSSHRPPFNDFYHRTSPSCLFARHALPTRSHTVPTRNVRYFRFHVAAFNSQGYRPTFKINIFPVHGQSHIPRRSRGRAFSSISPGCSNY